MSPAAGILREVAIACGGTGGHLFPGIAVADELRARDCAVTLLVSEKEIDQQAVKSARDVRVASLPAVGLTRRNLWAFARGFARSYRVAARLFRKSPPAIALGMGGFTAAPPLLAARRAGGTLFIHESNAIPGRANRWLARCADTAFIGYESAGATLRSREVFLSGTPVRREFVPRDPEEARRLLGLDPGLPTVLVMGGSQGAEGINRLVRASLPRLRTATPRIQWLHLSGTQGAEEVAQAYRENEQPARVFAFLDRMHLALAAATIALSRSGASSLAEIAAVRVPSILIPFPHATDNHQWHNADALQRSGAALLLDQAKASGDRLAEAILGLLNDAAGRRRMQEQLAPWHRADAAAVMADRMLRVLRSTVGVNSGCPTVARNRSSVLA